MMGKRQKRAKMSKILYAASTMSHINNFHLDYINALRGEGHTVLVMASGEGADFNIPFKKKIFARENGACRRLIREIFKREKFDAVVLNTSLAAFHIRLAMPRKNRPRVLNLVHGYLFSRDTGFLKTRALLLCEKLLRSKTDSIIVMNKEDEKIAVDNRLCRGKVYFSRGMGVKKKPISEKESEKIKAEFGGELNLAFVGELSSRKNQRFLISSLPILRKRIENIRLWLVGDGEERASLQALAYELGVSENVVFFGKRPNPCDFILASDLYVSAAIIEGLPFNIVEAMSVPKPLLISDIKGQTDLIENGKNGFLYPYGDMDGFCSGVLSFFDNSAQLDSEYIFKTYEKYSFDSVFTETLGLIKESISL